MYLIKKLPKKTTSTSGRLWRYNTRYRTIEYRLYMDYENHEIISLTRLYIQALPAGISGTTRRLFYYWRWHTSPFCSQTLRGRHSCSLLQPWSSGKVDRLREVHRHRQEESRGVNVSAIHATILKRECKNKPPVTRHWARCAASMSTAAFDFAQP